MKMVADVRNTTVSERVVSVLVEKVRTMLTVARNPPVAMSHPLQRRFSLSANTAKEAASGIPMKKISAAIPMFNT